MILRVVLCSMIALTAGCGNKKLRSEMEDLRAKLAVIEEDAGAVDPSRDCDVPEHSLDDTKLIRVLKSVGGSQFSVKDCGSIHYEAHGMTLHVRRFDNGDLLLTYVATGCEWTLAQINEWNRTKRLSRAYIDDDGDTVLEADLIAATGVSDEQVAVFADVFHSSAYSYSSLLAEYCGA